ncbi:MAG: NfeD family protein [Oscillospiraceae bacterium]|nr:NfeD family protein [Oscillospiraceae bacterium]
MISFSWPVFWIVAFIVFLIVEAAVPGLVSIWFAVGTLPALLSAFLGGSPVLQWILFIVSSVAALYFTRPLAIKYVNSRVQPTNADMLIGKDCVVKETVDNLHGTGAVSVGGKVWTARSEQEDEVLPENSVAEVLKIDGVKLIVRKKS